jgi:hypothetical protein
MPAVCASASEIASAVADAAIAKMAVFPKIEKTLRREMLSALMISLMSKAPLVKVYAAAIPMCPY